MCHFSTAEMKTHRRRSYGQIGTKLIFQACQVLYPGYEYPVEVSPIPPLLFLEAVLVPEIGTMLIQQDLNLSRDEALRVREQSSAYGMAVFAEPDEDGDEDDAGDKLIKNVSKVIRSAIETEDSGAADGAADGAVKRKLSDKAADGSRKRMKK